MTEALPRGNFGPGITTLPVISWFEFLLNDKLLENHLQLENPDPTPVQLIIQFLQQAESHQAANNVQQIIQREMSSPLPPIPTSNGPGPDQIKTEEQDTKLQIKELKKVTALKMLALKVTAYLNWNLTLLSKSVPLVMQHALLNELLKVTLHTDVDTVSGSVLEYEEISDQAVFALQLYYRWCLLAVVKDSFPSRPVRSFLQGQGQPDPNMTLAAANENLIRTLKERTAVFVANLEKCVHCGRTIKMPTAKSFQIPDEHTDDPQYDWDASLPITPDEYNCQIFYDLGNFYFYEKGYSHAYVMFKRCTELFDHLKSPVYCNIDETRLRGYMTGCHSLRGVTENQEVKPESLYEQAENSKKDQYMGIVEILLADNMKQELSTSYRSDIEADIADKGDSSTSLYVQVGICNVVRGVMEGKALVSLLADILEEAEKETVNFLLMVITKALMGASFTQKNNLKCFIWHLMDLSPAGSKFNTTVMSEPISDSFTKQELAEMKLLAEEDGSSSYGQIIDDDVTTACSSNPGSRDSSVSLGNAEHQLMYIYDPDIMRRLVVELCQKYNRSPAYVMSLNEKWKVPRDMHHIIMNLQASDNQAYVYLLIGKANHCMDVRIYDRARQLLYVADRVVAEMSYTLSKHVRWHILLADLQQYFLSETLAEQTSLNDLVKKTKTCITCVRLGQDVQPSRIVLEHCAAFLLNIRDWHYLANMDNSGCGHIELCRLFSCVCKELPSIKNARKPGRDLWEALRHIFTTSTQQNRGNSAARNSAIHREANYACVTKDAFIEFLKKIKEPSVLSVLISVITKYYNILRDDISCEISSDYIALWPTTLSNSSLINGEAVEEALSVLMQHVLRVNPAQPSWLRTQADIHFANNQFSPAMKYYMEAGVVASDFFSSAVPKSIYEDQVYRRMVKCCTYLQCHTQVAVLCQFLDEVDYTTAFKGLQEKNVYDAMDSYYPCVWDISILEFLVHLHTRRGEVEKRQAAMKALSQIDLNSNNPEDIVQRAVQMRKRKFLRSLAKQYL
ncbi:integrator complex subunit 8-like isoform X2 [Mizuhopecten yessoensis]|uniref:integrator complex subunit 8-like isoform X2 n=1 Tax=Mizuhopecten yessoensis TaxID=6573 RepID=UPI000B45D051|nr:integrator complex subunit 8-like isoform X2 [Mizuhopecten yessoensis]